MHTGLERKNFSTASWLQKNSNREILKEFTTQAILEWQICSCTMPSLREVNFSCVIIYRRIKFNRQDNLTESTPGSRDWDETLGSPLHSAVYRVGEGEAVVAAPGMYVWEDEGPWGEGWKERWKVHLSKATERFWRPNRGFVIGSRGMVLCRKDHTGITPL